MRALNNNPNSEGLERVEVYGGHSRMLKQVQNSGSDETMLKQVQHRFQINLTNQPNGIYILKFYMKNGEVRSTKIIKTK